MPTTWRMMSVLAALLLTAVAAGPAAAGPVVPHNLQLRGAPSPLLAQRLRGGHCQVPCGIFDDAKTVAEINEACVTIRKAIVQITELSTATRECIVSLKALTAQQYAQNMNQITRWVNTKELHADKIISLISEYCLCQRVKLPGSPGSPFQSESDYIQALQAHHKVMLAAVATKQSVDLDVCHALEHAVADFSKMYTQTHS
mmetsp:Transcript_15922/g.25342  ORF Transcript_15922/g.25342 Transcript_15922/m.25342 type:complete len:201 (+) Transcript_15922:54-656(+)